MTLIYGELAQAIIGSVPTGFPHKNDYIQAQFRLSPAIEFPWIMWLAAFGHR